MLGLYTIGLVKRVFFPTTRGADYISVLLPLAIAITAFLTGKRISEHLTTQILAYVGIVTLSVFIIRLLFTSPFGMWKEERGEVNRLRNELSRPERAILEHLSKYRAKARAKLSVKLEDMQSSAYSNEWSEIADKIWNDTINKIFRLEAEAGLAEDFVAARRMFTIMVRKDGSVPSAELPNPPASRKSMYLLQASLMGEISFAEMRAQVMAIYDTQ